MANEKLQALHDELRSVATIIKEYADKSNDKEYAWGAEDEEAWQRANEDVARLEQAIERQERANEVAAKLEERQTDNADRLLAEKVTGGATVPEDHRDDITNAQRLAFTGWLRGDKYASDSERRAAALCGVKIGTDGKADFPIEARAQSVGLGSAGGFTAPEGVMQPLAEAMLAFGALRPYATVLTTTNGNEIPMPTVDDTSNTGSDLGENATASTTDITFGKNTLSAYKLSSDIVKVSTELLEDSGFDIAALVGRLLGQRIARRSENKYAVGTGAGTIQGFTINAATGKTTASATAITVDELLDLIDSVDPAYYGNARFMLHNSVKTYIRKLKDGNGQYLWQSAVQQGDPNSLLGYPVAINQEMASSVATTNKTVAFGDFAHYYIRDVNSVRLVRMDERFADADQVGFIAHMRTDGLLDTNGNPVKLLVQA